MKRSKAMIACALLVALVVPARANDSAAAVGVGGLVLQRSDAISMDSEDLFISEAQVRVAYRFTNHSPRDIETLVSFPLPALPDDVEGVVGDTAYPDFRELGFRTTVDGAPVDFDVIERAELAGRDVTARLQTLGLPLHWYRGDGNPVAILISRMPPQQREQLVHEGLLRRARYEPGRIEPAWKVVTHVTRRQLFPAGRTVSVTHSYTPIAGGSVAGTLDAAHRGDPEFGFREHATRFCIDNGFLKGLDRRPGTYTEIWLRYVLTTGANWRGPIHRFRLVIDKGQPDNLVSFCMNGVRKISPTRFEVLKENFEPKTDLEVLIIKWIGPGE